MIISIIKTIMIKFQDWNNEHVYKELKLCCLECGKPYYVTRDQLKEIHKVRCECGVPLGLFE